MFFDSLAVLVLTFFASVGMVEVAEWLLKNPLRKDIKKKVFVVAKISSVPEENIEPAFRTLLSETDGMNRMIFLDLSNCSNFSVDVCKKLERRFDCKTFYNNEELVSLINEYLQER